MPAVDTIFATYNKETGFATWLNNSSVLREDEEDNILNTLSEDAEDDIGILFDDCITRLAEIGFSLRTLVRLDGDKENEKTAIFQRISMMTINDNSITNRTIVTLQTRVKELEEALELENNSISLGDVISINQTQVNSNNSSQTIS